MEETGRFVVDVDGLADNNLVDQKKDAIVVGRVGVDVAVGTQIATVVGGSTTIECWAAIAERCSCQGMSSGCSLAGHTAVDLWEIWSIEEVVEVCGFEPDGFDIHYALRVPGLPEAEL